MLKPRLIALCVTLSLLPPGLKLTLPALLRNQGVKLLAIVQPDQHYTVESVQGYALVVRTPDRARIRVRLAGLQPSRINWQNQAAAVMTMVLSSQAEVSLTSIQPSEQPDEVRAIVQLSNGTPLQQILLTDGLAKLDRSQPLPANFSRAFQEAEASARSQHKNIWGEVTP